jgi:mono/diheme cytochrome c family protein
MNRTSFASITLLIGLLALLLLINPRTVYSQTTPSDLARGAGLYDNWYAMLGVNPPQGNMPIWDRQNTNTRSGADTWRCVTCHGWDYQGNDGAYKTGSNYTGFPGVFNAGRDKSSDEIIAILSGKDDPAHDFSAYLDDQSMRDVALFLNKGLIDDSVMIDPVSYRVSGGDISRGNHLYEDGCASCHGADGTKIIFRYEGLNATLGDLAAQDPWRFLHKSRFGTPGTAMPVGYNLGWTPQEGRDALLFAQTMPRNIALPQQTAVMQQDRVAPAKLGGPANNFFSGLLTAISAMAVGLGFNVIIGASLVGILLILVWILRGKK